MEQNHYTFQLGRTVAITKYAVLLEKPAALLINRTQLTYMPTCSSASNTSPTARPTTKQNAEPKPKKKGGRRIFISRTPNLSKHMPEPPSH